MKQKERFDEKPKQEHTEPKHHRKSRCPKKAKSLKIYYCRI